MQLSTIYPTILEQGGHTLIAGTTGSGKSVMLNGIITTALLQGDKYLIYLDPKKIELRQYKDTCSCLYYADDETSCVAALKYACDIMESRYTEMQSKKQKLYEGLPILVCIDELADLLISESAKEVKRLIQKLTQLGRACKLFLIACTQAPARKILPAEITLNFTQRIGLRCLTATESRQAINDKGCENLAMYGECLYMRPAHRVELWDFEPVCDNDIDYICDVRERKPEKKKGELFTHMKWAFGF